MIRTTDAMIKAANIAKLKEEIQVCRVSIEKAKAAGVQYAVNFFQDMIETKEKQLAWLREHLVHPGC